MWWPAGERGTRADTERVSKNSRYVPDPATRSRPLTTDEVDALILSQGKALTKDSDAMVHFLHRVSATLRDHRGRMTGLSHDFSRMQAGQITRSHPVARAIEAIAALSPQERTQVLDAGYAAEVSRLERAQEELALARTAMANESNRMRFALATFIADETLPASARQGLADAVARLQSFSKPDV